MIETIDIADAWLYATLSADTQLMDLVDGRITGTLGAVTLAAPYVHFMLSSTLDVNGVGGARISTDNLYIAKGVSQGSTWDDVSPIARRIDYLIHRPNSVMMQGSGSLSCIRERILQVPEVDGGLQYRHLGGYYRIRASADE